MNISDLRKSLSGSYDLDKLEDCKEVIEVLLADLSRTNERAAKLSTELRSLANMVAHGKSARKKAND